jgi:peptide deformylase
VPVREVLVLPHPLLKRSARPVDPRDTAAATRVAVDLLDTMRAHRGCVGLAAPQVGELVRMIVVDVHGHPKATSTNGLIELVNPELVSASGSEVGREGCLSIPDLTANVRRATRIVVEGELPIGGRTRIESEGFEARAVLHELDHLDGILFLDRVESRARDVFTRKRRQDQSAGPSHAGG